MRTLRRREVFVLTLPEAEAASDHDIASTDAYKLHRILHGVPEGTADIPPTQAFPMESNLDIMGGRTQKFPCFPPVS